MTERNREGVGRVVRHGVIPEAEQCLHHELHLLLGCIAVANDGFLHLARGVLGKGELMMDCCKNAHSSGLSEHQCRSRVLPGECRLDGHFGRAVCGDDADEAIVDPLQPFRQRRAGLIGDCPRRDVTVRLSVLRNDPVSGHQRTRVDAQDD